jgi:squalene-hopene/tetraprenyl-beta-curcumene cyclase
MWLNFGLEPWEANDSQYYGASLEALAGGRYSPENYHSAPEIQDQLKLLRGYLGREYAIKDELT